LLAKGGIELSRGRAAVASAIAEQALRQWEQAGAPAQRLGEARFLLAKALAASEPPQREEARRLAEQVRADLASDADPQAMRLRRDVDTWLAELKRPDPPR
jgi:hypothetical protein